MMTAYSLLENPKKGYQDEEDDFERADETIVDEDKSTIIKTATDEPL